jgi:hypothetical protein
MKTTTDPEIVYDAFSRYGMAPLRIDCFDRGDYAEIRLEIKSGETLNLEEVQHIINNLRLLQKGEEVEIQIVNIDARHGSMKVNLTIPGQAKTDNAAKA